MCAFLEPIALYMAKDLYEPGDGQWLTEYPAPGEAMALGEGRVYGEGDDLVIFTFGNGVPMSLRAARDDRSASTAGRCAWSTCAGSSNTS